MSSLALRGQRSAVVSAFVATWLTWAGTASGQIYVSKFGNNVGQYTQTGSTINPTLVSGVSPFDIAISDGKLYAITGTSPGNRVGVFDAATGAVINPSLMALPYDSGVYSLAVSGSDLFVARSSAGVVDRYTTSGAVVTPSLVTGLNGPFGIAVSGGNLFVDDTDNHAVREYTTSGAVVNAALVTNFEAIGLAVAGNDLYLINHVPGTVGKFDATTGAAINASLITGLHEPFDIAVFGDRLYVPDTNAGRVSEYTTSGVLVNAALISGSGFTPVGIAVVPEPSSLACCAFAAAVALPRRRHS